MADYDTTLTASVTLDATTPLDSLLSYDSGLENTPYTQGSHDGGNASADLIDSGKDGLWGDDDFNGYTVYNQTADESATVTDTIASTYKIVGTLSGSETWDNDDTYIIQHPTLLTDSTKSWTTNQWQNFKLVNSTDGSSGTISSNTPTTITVSSLTGGTNNVFRIGDDYQIVVDALTTSDKIYYDPSATDGVVRWQLYDASDATYSVVYETTLETDPLRSGTVTVSAAGVPSIDVPESPAAAATTTTKGGYVPPVYVKGNRGKRDESILEAVQQIVNKMEGVPVAQKVIDRVEKTVREVKQVDNTAELTELSQYRKQLTNLKSKVKRLESAVDKAITEAREDEDAAIKALLELL